MIFRYRVARIAVQCTVCSIRNIGLESRVAERSVEGQRFFCAGATQTWVFQQPDKHLRTLMQTGHLLFG